MSILVLQIIIQQWDKSQRTAEHIAARASQAKHYPVVLPPAFYISDQQCLIDPHGDDVLGKRVRYAQPDNDTLQIDHFQLSLSNKTLEYIGPRSAELAPRSLGSTDNKWVQCHYAWRYSVYEGGFYYWLYEDVTLNAMTVSVLDENIFMNSEPEIVFADLV